MAAFKSKVLTLLAGTILIGGCISQDDFYLLRGRVDALERQRLADEKKISEFESRLNETGEAEDKKDQMLRIRSAESHAALDQMREDIRTLRGQIEETQYQLKQRLNLEPAKKMVEKKMPARAPEEKALSPAALYKAARQAFDNADFDTARDKFQTYLAKYPKSSDADNAQFWIGETYYREKWYEKAILEYQKVIENYPNGNKVQAALLKQGLAFLNLGDRANSRLILKELANKYPKSNEAGIAVQKLKEIK